MNPHRTTALRPALVNVQRHLPCVGKNGSKKCAPPRLKVEKWRKVCSTWKVESVPDLREFAGPVVRCSESTFHLEKWR